VSYPFNVVTLGGTPNTLTLNGSGPPGLALSFSPSTFSMVGNTAPNLMVSAQPSPSLAPGTYPVTINAVGDGEIYSETLNVQVVKYLVVTIAATFQPANLTVPAGSSVTWLRLNGPLGCGCVDDGSTNVRFLNTSIQSSGTLQQYGSYSYTFTKPGTFAYICDFRAGETGTITVTP
jgi:plastocyanin